VAGGADKPFDAEMRSYFGCTEGAYSKVTSTEAGDGQITLTGDEKRIVLDFFGEDELDKFRGSDRTLRKKGLDARRSFRIFPTGEAVRPKVLYPKPDKSELRLYFSDQSFKVRAGYYWGVFKRDDELWLCSFGSNALNVVKVGKLAQKTRLQVLDDDEDDEAYQEAANDPKQIDKHGKAWKRNPKLGAQAIADAHHKCELFPTHKSFKSKASGRPFMEAHHIVPLGLQKAFTKPNQNLDKLDNVCCVNPWSHRLLHHGRFEDFETPLMALLKCRPRLLQRLSLTVEDVLAYYR
jgi:5-methylcytosine-specific restriction enzyme A